MKHSCCQSKEIEEVYREITGAPSENIFLNVGIERDLFYNLQSHKAKTERSCPRLLKSTFYLNPLLATQISLS